MSLMSPDTAISFIENTWKPYLEVTGGIKSIIIIIIS